jgi:hypothetical protein
MWRFPAANIEYPVSDVQQVLESMPAECPVLVTAFTLTAESKELRSAFCCCSLDVGNAAIAACREGKANGSFITDRRPS